MDSLERIQRYLDIDHEPKPTKEGQPPASWPTSGDLRVDNLSACYSHVRRGKEVLFSFSFFLFILVWSHGLAQPVFPYQVWGTHRCW